MKKITLAQNEMYHIISEPGDGTRYDYFVYINDDEYCFMPRKSTFRYPQRLNYWDINNNDFFNIDINRLTNEFIKLSEHEYCNPYTLMECIQTIKQLREEYLPRW